MSDDLREDPHTPINLRDHRWIEVGSVDWMHEIMQAINDLIDRVIVLEARVAATDRHEQAPDTDRQISEGETLKNYADWMAKHGATIQTRDWGGHDLEVTGRPSDPSRYSRVRCRLCGWTGPEPAIFLLDGEEMPRCTAPHRPQVAPRGDPPSHVKRACVGGRLRTA